MSIVMYSTGCPRCNILKKKLDEKKINYTEVNDVEEMTKLGINKVPVLEVDGAKYSYADAIKLINGGL